MRALQYLSRAAAQGYAPARVRLGDFYYYGWGTDVDFNSAAGHYRIASDQLHSAQVLPDEGVVTHTRVPSRPGVTTPNESTVAR